MSGSPRESHPRAPTDRSVTVARHSALTIQSGGNGASMPSGEQGWVALYDLFPPRLEALERTQPLVFLATRPSDSSSTCSSDRSCSRRSLPTGVPSLVHPRPTSRQVTGGGPPLEVQRRTGQPHAVPCARPSGRSKVCRCDRSHRAKASSIAVASCANVCRGPTANTRPGRGHRNPLASPPSSSTRTASQSQPRPDEDARAMQTTVPQPAHLRGKNGQTERHGEAFRQFE